ncbi:SbcC/MukB-like Walker B domain-containing protein [Paracoccus sp. MC1862]|uniref:SbcC/MukB-like Walker B domain-containing protein n=1 Tax=Paracoccus sp. MC1862 TaxID=2760307 RepID=UPI001909B809|nr:SbcC/MukB-like Walker B domain-containing protein [Paracoccus sp. MC1862]QQO46002.1 hypothetical protein JGR78_06905 [Paracoccus sp. MC1862]
MVGAWDASCKARDKAEKHLAELGPKIASAGASCEAATQGLEKASAMASGRRDALAGLKSERSQLLDGEETGAHRTRWNNIRLEAQDVRDGAVTALSEAATKLATATSRQEGVTAALEDAWRRVTAAESTLAEALQSAGLTPERLAGILAMRSEEIRALRQKLQELDQAVTRTATTAHDRSLDYTALLEAGVPERDAETLRAISGEIETAQAARRERMGAISNMIVTDDLARASLADLDRQIEAAKLENDTWTAVNHAVGSRSGDKFARIAQAVTLGMLVERANQHLAELKPRYRLAQAEGLALHVIDADMAGEVRSTRSLSGGERFFVSLSLALALSRMGGQGGMPTTLFIDEGFGSLDSESLDLAINALERLQSQGRTIGVISHVAAMKERIPVQVKVMSRGSGRSTVTLAAA